MGYLRRLTHVGFPGNRLLSKNVANSLVIFFLQIVVGAHGIHGQNGVNAQKPEKEPDPVKSTKRLKREELIARISLAMVTIQ